MPLLYSKRPLLILCILLAAATSTALVANHRLRLHQGQMEAELAQLRPLALAVAKSQAARLSATGSRPLPSLSHAKTNRPATPLPATDIEADAQAFQAEIQNIRAHPNSNPAPAEAYSRTNQPAEEDGASRGRRGRWREDDMEKLKQTDPQRFQEIESQRTAFRERLNTDTQDKYAFLSSMDVSQWAADMQANHAKVVDLYARMAEATGQTEGGAAANHDAQRQLFAQWHETGEQLQVEQDMLLYDTAKQLGFEGGNADQFVEYIKTIHQATSPRGFFPGRGMSRQRGTDETTPAPRE